MRAVFSHALARERASSDPLWREVAYWCVIIMFFALPLLVFALHITALVSPKFPGEFSYLMQFHRILAGLLAAMLGFNSWDKRLKNGGNGFHAKGQDAHDADNRNNA
jgi:hypothetical protein